MENLITQWLTASFKNAIILALLVIVLVLRFGLAQKVKRWLRMYFGVQEEIQDSQTRLASGYKDERDEANRKIERLTATISDCRRKMLELQEDIDTRSDISAQDRAYIRALERICTEKDIDFSHTKESIKEQYVIRKTWE